MNELARLTLALEGRYRLERPLGSGGMATVWLAEDVKHRRRVAIKVLRPELSAILGEDRFLKEIEVTAHLQHPHILPLFDSGAADGFFYYVMPYVPGESLRDLLAREKQLPVSEAVAIAKSVASALDYAHRQGVIHRDIKPENILIQDGHPLVADFGIALAVSRAGGSRVTETGLSLGTPQYMSPEQAMADRELTPRSDVYALGAVTYEMLAGDPPHTGSSAQAILAKLITEHPRPIHPQRPTVPEYVDEAVLVALEKLPADRWASAREFAEALDGGHPDRTASRPAAAASPATPTQAGTKARTVRPVVAWLGWLVAAAVLGALVLVLSRARPQPASAPVASMLAVSLLPPPGQEFSDQYSFGALSRDGTRFAFVAQSSSGETALWVRSLDSLDARELPGTAGAEAPFWSPDGRTLGYFAAGRLWRIDADGGAPREICPAPNQQGGAWGDSGAILFVAADALHRITASGSQPAIVLVGGDSIDLRRPAFLPGDQRALLTVVHSSNSYGAAVVDLASGRWSMLRDSVLGVTFVGPDILLATERRPTLRGNELVGQRIDLSSGKLLGHPIDIARNLRTAAGNPSFTASPTGRLLYLPSRGADPGKVETERGGRIIDSVRQIGSWTHRQAHRGPLVALGGSTLVLYDRDRDVPRVLADGMTTWPAWSPDDSAIVARQACSLVRWQVGDGRETVFYQAHGRCLSPTDWSPDGRTIVATLEHGDTAAQSEIWGVDPVTGSASPLFASRGSVSEGRVSPDGRWLAYRSDESGTSQVYVRPFHGDGADVRISLNGGRSPYWSRGGRELVYLAPDGSVMAVALPAGRTLRPPEPVTLFAAPQWNRRDYFELSSVPFDVSLDGERFIFKQPNATTAGAVLIEDWRTRLDTSKTHSTQGADR